MKKLLAASLVILVVGVFASGDLFAGDERIIEQEFKMKMGATLELEIETGGSIEIEGWDKQQTAVKVRIEGRDRDDVLVHFKETSSGLKIHSEFEGRRKNRKSDVLFIIKVPEKTNIEVETLGGDLVIVNVEGEFEGETMGGDIQLDKIKGEVQLETMGGDVSVTKSEVDGKVKTMGGDITIADVVGNVKGSTMGGDVTYRNVTRHKGKGGEEEVQISTMGGDIDIDYAGKKVSAKTYGGDIDVAKSEEVQVTTMGGDINVGDAPAGAEVKTMGGDVTIRSAGEYVKAGTMGGDIEIDAIDGWVEATTMGGDITVTMVGDPEKGKRDVELESKGGDIELVVPAGLSMEFDIELAYTRDSDRDYEIVSDFDMNIEKSTDWERKWGEKVKYIYGTGSVKGGKHMIRIKTVNGDIYIKKGK
jgi:DUF4097 and DUF4098 domain-containing protein YvlB